MNKNIAFICYFFFFTYGCQKDHIKKNLLGQWSISYMDNRVVEENIESCLYSNWIWFKNYEECVVPLIDKKCLNINITDTTPSFGIINNTFEETVNWEIQIENGCYYLVFKTENLPFSGKHNLFFRRDKKNQLLQIHLLSNNLYIIANKALTNYNSNEKEMHLIENITQENCK